MQSLVAIIRLLGIILVIFICFFIVLVFFPITPKKYWIYIVRAWAKSILFCVGITIEIIGKHNSSYTRPNSMIISNHISWLDIPLLYTIYSLSFIGRAEIKKWPILNIMAKSGGTIFLDRKNKRELMQINQVVANQLSNGATIGLFPEGMTSDGKQVLPFKAPLLEAAIMANSTIVPLVIKYYTKAGIRTHAVTYAGEITLWKTVKNSLFLNGIHAKILLLPEFKATQFTTREKLSAYLFSLINEAYTKEI